VEVEYCGTILLLAADALAAMFYVYKNTTQKASWIRRTSAVRHVSTTYF